MVPSGRRRARATHQTVSGSSYQNQRVREHFGHAFTSDLLAVPAGPFLEFAAKATCPGARTLLRSVACRTAGLRIVARPTGCCGDRLTSKARGDANLPRDLSGRSRRRASFARRRYFARLAAHGSGNCIRPRGSGRRVLAPAAHKSVAARLLVGIFTRATSHRSDVAAQLLRRVRARSLLEPPSTPKERVLWIIPSR